MVTLIGMVVAALAAYYILVTFIYPLKSPDIMPEESFSGITQAHGVIVAVDRDSVVLGTTTMLTIATDNGEQKRVRIPQNPGNGCLSTNIVDPAGLVAGDVIDVKGADSNGEIFPCQETEHHVVRVMTAVPKVIEEVVTASSTSSTTQDSAEIPESI